MIIIFKSYSVVSEASEVGGADSSRRRTRRFCEICYLKTMIIRRTRTHSWRWLKCLKSDRRNGKYAAMCQVSGDEGCLVAMVLVGFSVVGLLIASSCTWLISVGPGCVGGSLWGSCTRWAFPLWMMFPYLCLSTPVLIIMLPNSGSVSLHLFENPVGCLSE